MVNWLVARQNWTCCFCYWLWTLPFNSNARSTNCPFQMFSFIWLDTNYISISFEFNISKGSLSPAGRAVAAVCWWPDIEGTSMSETRSMCRGQVGWLRWGGPPQTHALTALAAGRSAPSCPGEASGDQQVTWRPHESALHEVTTRVALS